MRVLIVFLKWLCLKKISAGLHQKKIAKADINLLLRQLPVVQANVIAVIHVIVHRGRDS